MAAILSVLIAIFRSTWRNLRGLGSFVGNNIFAVIVLLMAEEPVDRPSSTAVFYLVIGFFYALPLAQELSRRIPAVRFRLWPLDLWQRGIIRAANLALNPLLVLALLFSALSRHPAVGFGLLLSGVAAPIAVMAVNLLLPRLPRASQFSLIRIVPRFPGRLGGLIQNHLRELLQLLDVYFAALLAASGIVYLHLDPQPDPGARLGIGVLVVVFLSTAAQPNLGFDAAASITRARLLPLTGTQQLLAKDIAWFAVVLPLIAFYPLQETIAAALAAAAAGNQTALRTPLEQTRWHFASGVLAPAGIFQLLALIAAAGATARFGWPILLIALTAYFGSLWYIGRIRDALPH